MSATARTSAQLPCKHIVIIGAGYSGSVLSAHLLREVSMRPTLITLVEQRAEVGRGIAYAKRDYPYLLNVPASRMSADSRDPLQFVRFAKRRHPSVCGEDFLPREIYGDYLQSLLIRAKRAAPSHLTLSHLNAQARRVIPNSHNPLVTVQLGNGESLLADVVVIATGHPRPADLPNAASLRGHPGYVDVPWLLPPTHEQWRNVLIVGTGLSMVDTFSRLTADPSKPLRLYAISRHGLLPQPQIDFQTSRILDSNALLSESGSLCKLMRSVRTLAKAVEHVGGDWREVITFVRNVAPHLWQQLADSERRRFIRHVNPYWNMHRHRIPPTADEHLSKAQQSKQLQVHAGRIQSIAPSQHNDSQLKVVWRPRGDNAHRELIVDAVINACGPNYCLHSTSDSLLRRLYNDGLIVADDAALGIRTDATGALIGVNGQAHSNIFYLGPLLRADYWEATAATELRSHAEKLAARLAAGNRQRSLP